MPVKSKFTKR